MNAPARGFRRARIRSSDRTRPAGFRPFTSMVPRMPPRLCEIFTKPISSLFQIAHHDDFVFSGTCEAVLSPDNFGTSHRHCALCGYDRKTDRTLSTPLGSRSFSKHRRVARQTARVAFKRTTGIPRFAPRPSIGQALKSASRKQAVRSSGGLHHRGSRVGDNPTVQNCSASPIAEVYKSGSNLS
jgi:hypothetical protein